MEIYSRTSSKISFEAPSPDTVVSATAKLNGGTAITLVVDPPVTGSKMRYAALPYVFEDGEVSVDWAFTVQTFQGPEPIVVTNTYDVVTAILSTAEIKQIHPRATDDEIVRVEKATRHIINSHTGQTFGRYSGIKNVRGNNSTALVLPQRLISLTAVNNESANRYALDHEGSILRYYPFGVPPVKADYDGFHMHSGGVIHNPNNVQLGLFSSTITYRIDGQWGWREVPDAVKEAAKLLVNDYACADAAYRDRYLTSMTAADWRIQFNALAWDGTGNARADELLKDFVTFRGWVV